MNYHYLLWASGEDQPGLVAALTKELFAFRCNLEDSSMMRLGSEFGIFLILSSKRILSPEEKSRISDCLRRKVHLSVGIKQISERQAKFRASSRQIYLVAVHGHDRLGLVYSISSCLVRHGFNITDLSTHRTLHASKAGYILLIEGELPPKASSSALKRSLNRLQKRLSTKITIQPLSTDIL